MYLNRSEIVLFYNQQKPIGKKTLALAKSLGAKVNQQEIHDTRISPTLFGYTLAKANAEGKHLMNKSLDYYQAYLAGNEIDAEEALACMKSHPEVFEFPLAFWKNKADICRTPTDIFKLYQA